MANPQNLTPFRPNREDTVKNARKGGKRSAEVKRARKSMTDQLLDLLALPEKQGKSADFEKTKSLESLEGANLTGEQQVILAAFRKAKKGEIKAIEFIWNLVGGGAGGTVTPLQELASSLEKYKEEDEDD